jgi:hypothetical protein
LTLRTQTLYSVVPCCLLFRPTMIRYGVKNIRDLVGHKCSLDFMRTNPICDIQLDDKYDASAFVGPAPEQ